MHGILEDGGILHEEEGEVNSVDTERVDDTFGLRERGVGVPVTEADGRGVALGNKTSSFLPARTSPSTSVASPTTSMAPRLA